MGWDGVRVVWLGLGYRLSCVDIIALTESRVFPFLSREISIDKKVQPDGITALYFICIPLKHFSVTLHGTMFWVEFVRK